MSLRRGQIVKVVFWDHVEGGSRPIKFAIYGELSAIDRRSICVDAWAYANGRRAHDPRNETRFTILRSTIESVTRLVPA